jgi:hypothetical protein
MIEAFTAAILGGAVTGFVTVITIKIDVGWMKKTLEKFDDRITFLEHRF